MLGLHQDYQVLSFHPNIKDPLRSSEGQTPPPRPCALFLICRKALTSEAFPVFQRANSIREVRKMQKQRKTVK